MKIGILTYYGDLNCGTNLQAYATLQAVSKAYPDDDVEIIPFHGFMPRILPYKNLSPASIYKDIVRIKKYFNFKKNNLNIKEQDKIIRNVSSALQYIEARNYDVIYVGADTLLELDRLPQNFDGLSAYWLLNVKAKKNLIAASAKNTEYDKLSPHQKEEISIAVKQFNYLGVRDHATKELLKRFISEEQIDYVPDPTFTLKIDYTYVESYLRKKKLSIPQKSVFIHTYGNDYWAASVAKSLQVEGYFVVTPRPTKWSNLSLNDMGPLEQLGIYRYFELVITHRFHDSVFCLKNGTPFLLYEKGVGHATSDGDSKFTSLLKDFNLYPYCYIGAGADVTSDRFFEKREQSIFLFNNNMEYIIKLLHEKREQYLHYLEETKI